MRKRFVTVEGHRFSILLEDAFWTELIAICRDRGLSLEAFVAHINAGGRHGKPTLSAALRAYILRDLVRRRRPMISGQQRPAVNGNARDTLGLRLERHRRMMHLIARSNEALAKSTRLLAMPVHGGSPTA
jgi:predicted DNA-binding ribbon-helix-helix protein